MQIVLLSGSVSSGKTTLSEQLQSRFGFEPLKTNKVLRELAIEELGESKIADRRAMQKFGERLDVETDGKWVLKALNKLLWQANTEERGRRVIVDAVRISQQIHAIRQAYGYAVIHIHLTAPTDVLERRYLHRKGTSFRELGNYSAVQRDRTESQVRDLEGAADIVISTDRCRPEDVLARAASHLGLFSRDCTPLVDVIIGGQYGSEGKGHIASYLARDYSYLVRVGGPNAGHKVFMLPEPYTHHQLPSGTLRNSEARLILSPGCVLNADKLLKEIAECKVGSDRLSIDGQAMIIEQGDIDTETKLVKDIGSTGQGVGAAMSRRIMKRGRGIKLAREINALRPFIKDTWKILEDAYRDGQKVLVEGTQGAGLSLYHGQYPYVTSRDTSVAGCLSEAGIPARRVRKVVMVCRTYPIRVQSPKGGTSGEMGRGIRWSTVERRAKFPNGALSKNERTSTTNRRRRVAEFNWELLRRTSALNGPTDIALTFVDYIDIANERARRFELLTGETINFIEEVERVASAPVSLISTRFGFRSIIDRRTW